MKYLRKFYDEPFPHASGRPSISLRDIVVRYGDVTALDHFNLYVDQGEFLVMLGASGCGKTTTLRALAGLETPVHGEILIGEQCVFSSTTKDDVPPKDRNVGLVFQNYALYPHMTVRANVAFSLTTRRVRKEIIELKVEDVLDLVGLTGLEERYPRHLSGGQQQRVAIARMLVAEPSVLLFDEPLSNIDVKMRSSLRADLKKLHRKIGATTIYVTHDQTEALALADRIAVMLEGAVEQVGTPREIYQFPATVAVAEFTGVPKTNLLRGPVRTTATETEFLPVGTDDFRLRLPPACSVYDRQEVVLNIRPEDLAIKTEPYASGQKLSVFAVQPYGATSLIHLNVPGSSEPIIARQTGAEAPVRRGQGVGIQVRKGNIFDAQTERLIDSFGLD